MRIGLMTCLILGMMAGQGVAMARNAPTGNDFLQWAQDTQNRIIAEFAIPNTNIYADKITVGKPASGPAFMWGCGVLLPSFVGAAKLMPDTYMEDLNHYLEGLKVYWVNSRNVSGFNVLPKPSPPDRYYDDNEWMVIALVGAYEDNHNIQTLRWAEDTFKFVLSGMDDQLGGGIYWHEQKRNSKNTCSNAPAIVGALRLYQVTRQKKYLDIAQRLYTWVNAHLQDPSGLYYDNIKLNGTVEKTEWSYNSALMIRANALLYAITNQESYLKEAERIATAAEAKWIDPNTGAFIHDGGVFAHLLAESFLSLYNRDKNPHWLQLVQKGLIYVHANCRDSNGNYTGGWSQPVAEPLKTVKLIDEASVARAYWLAAGYP